MAKTKDTQSLEIESLIENDEALSDDEENLSRISESHTEKSNHQRSRALRVCGQCMMLAVASFSCAYALQTLIVHNRQHRGSSGYNSGLSENRHKKERPSNIISDTNTQASSCNYAKPSQKLFDLYQPVVLNNTSGHRPPFWNEENFQVRQNNDLSVGPCYLPDANTETVVLSNTMEFSETKSMSLYSSKNTDQPCYHGGCRPGFLIIGAGKCGTSSLYHYLIGHPQVLPAKTKQIHFFKFYVHKGMSWYLSQFPTADAFLSSGALLTGEAAPGYLPYPDVAERTRNMLPGTRIILIAREPIDRAWSSYNYNYIRNGISKLKRRPSAKGKSDDALIKGNFFSFEEMMRAELDILRDCLKPGGKGFVDLKWAKAEIERRKKEGLPPMIDVIGQCYPENENQYAGRSSKKSQWQELVAKDPKKVIQLSEYFLYESLIGRGMYAAQVEWWYAAFPSSDVTLVCSEDLKYNTTRAMNSLSDFLGLPAFDYTDVVSEGMYNVKGHQGYDKAVSWEEEQKTEQNDTIPLSAEFRAELQAFFDEQNERLFALTGIRCPW